jgi:hypothetical protein
MKGVIFNRGVKPNEISSKSKCLVQITNLQCSEQHNRALSRWICVGAMTAASVQTVLAVTLQSHTIYPNGPVQQSTPIYALCPAKVPARIPVCMHRGNFGDLGDLGNCRVIEKRKAQHFVRLVSGDSPMCPTLTCNASSTPAEVAL